MATESLTEKYRPRRFEHVVGQAHAVGELRARAINRNPQSIILVGPPGVGKTSLARIYANARACERREQPICGVCEPCKAFEQNNYAFQLFEYEAGQFPDRDHASLAAQFVKQGIWGGGYGIFIDEVHALDPGAADSLLGAAENPTRESYFVFATTDLNSVRSALVSRCVVLELPALSQADALRLLHAVTHSENMTVETQAADMLIARARGSARDLIKALDQVAVDGVVVTVDRVADKLALRWTGHVTDYFEALAGGDIAAQERAIFGWLAPAPMRARAIREALIYLENYELVRPPITDIVNPAFYLITAAQRRRIMDRFEQRAADIGMSFRHYWAQLLAFWDTPVIEADDLVLKVRLRRFNDLVNPGPPSEPAQDRRISRIDDDGRRPRLRTATVGDRSLAPGKVDLSFLTRSQVEGIYDCASFLVQRHGVLFNTGLTLRHGLLGVQGEKAATSLVSLITHELGLRLRSWEAGAWPAHWIYLHARDGDDLISELVLHIPTTSRDRVADWMSKRIAALCGHCPLGWSLDSSEPPSKRTDRDQALQVARHWRLVRRLWSGIPATLMHWDEAGRRSPLYRLLGLRPAELRSVGRLGSAHRWSASRSLGRAARRLAAAEQMGFLSAFADGAWDRLPDGWELDEHRDRVAEAKRRREAVDLVDATWEAAGGDLVKDRRDEALRTLRQSWPTDPRRRRRSWSGWWT